MNKLITIIIPVYNAAPYLEECLKSVDAACLVLEEKRGHLGEVICIDDGSTDGSGELLDRYAEGHQRVRVLHKENGGVSSARNAGIRMARGEWVHFVDADDWVEQSLYADLAGWVDKCPKAEFIAFGTLEMNQDRRIIRKWGEGRAPTEVTGDELLGDERYGVFAGCIWNKIYKGETLKRTGLLFNTNMQPCEDNLFNMMFLTHCHNVVVRPEVFGYYYRAVQDSCVHTMTAKKLLFAVEQFLNLHDRWREIRTPGLERLLARLARGLLFLGKHHSRQLRRECVDALTRATSFRDVVIPYLHCHGAMKDRMFTAAYCLMPRWVGRMMLKLI